MAGLAACAGGGARAPLPGLLAGFDLSAGSGGTGNVRFTIVVPARPQSAENPAYVSPSTQGIGIVAQPSSRAKRSYFFALGSSEKYCSGGTASTPLTCSVTAQVPAGSVKLAIAAYAGTSSKSAILATETLAQKIARGKTKTIRLAMSGAVAFLQTALDDPFPGIGKPSKITVRVIAADADGYLILGPYSAPLAVTDSDTSGVTKLSATTLHSSTDASKLTLAYSGKKISTATVSVSAGKKTVAKTELTPGANGIVASPATLLAAYDSPETLVSLGGPGTKAPFTLSTGSDAAHDTPCSAYVSISSASGADFALTATGRLGVCWLAASDSAGHRSAIPVLVSGFGWPVPLPTPTPVSIATGAPFASSTSQPIATITPAPPGHTPQPIVVKAGAGGGFTSTLTFSVTGASAIAANTTLASTLTNEAIAAGPLAIEPAAQSASPVILVTDEQTFSNDLTVANQPSHSYVLPSSLIVAGAHYWLAFYDPTRPSLGWQLGYEGPASVNGTTVNFTGSPGFFTFKAGQKYYYAVYALSIAAATPSPAPAATPTGNPSPTPGVMTVTVACAQSTDACANGTTSAAGSVEFTAVNDTATFTPHESAAGTTFKLQSDTCNTTDDPSATGNWATLSPGPGNEAQLFVATAVNASSGSNPATCAALLKDSFGQTVTINIQVTIGNVGINGK